MRKISRLSLIAAIAVAGFSTANAKPLEEAIKDVDVSGSVFYRYNNYHNDVLKNRFNPALGKEGSTSNNNYKAALSLSSKANDFVKVNTRFLVSKPTSYRLDLGDPLANPPIDPSVKANPNDGEAAKLDTTKNGDQGVEVILSQAYFSLTSIKNTTINVGKQGLTTPWTVATDSGGNEQTGTGVLGLSTWGPITVAAAYFNQTNLDKSGNLINDLPIFAQHKSIANVGTFDIATAGVIGNFGPITADVWYLTMDNTFKTYNVGVEGKFDLSKGSNIGFEIRYVDGTTAPIKDQKLTKLVVNGKFGIVNAKVAYAKSGKNGGLTALDSDAKTAITGWGINTLDLVNDGHYIQAVLGIDILKNLNLSANYGTLEDKDKSDGILTKSEMKEVYGQLTYKMSKNLSTYIRYGTYTNDDKISDGTTTNINDDIRGRLQVEYTF